MSAAECDSSDVPAPNLSAERGHAHSTVYGKRPSSDSSALGSLKDAHRSSSELHRLVFWLAHSWVALFGLWLAAVHELGRQAIAHAPLLPGLSLPLATALTLGFLGASAAFLYRHGWLAIGRSTTILRWTALAVTLTPLLWREALGDGLAAALMLYLWLPAIATALGIALALAWKDWGTITLSLGAFAVWLRPTTLLFWIAAHLMAAWLLSHINFGQSLPLIGLGLGVAAGQADRIIAILHRRPARRALERRAGLALAIFCLLLLALSPRTSAGLRRKILDATPVFSLTDALHHLEITSAQGQSQLFIDGELKHSSLDYYRYYESLTHPALVRAPRITRVVAFSSGLGLLEREILRHPEVMRLDVVVDSPVGPHASHRLHSLAVESASAMDSERVDVIVAEPSEWLSRTDSMPPFDAAIVDLPDPTNDYWGKYYTRHFFRMLEARLAPDAVIEMQGTRNVHTASILCQSARAAGWHAIILRAPIPSMGEWHMILASPRPILEPIRPLPSSLRFVDPRVMASLTLSPPDAPKVRLMPVSLLHEPRAMDTFIAEGLDTRILPFQ